MTTTEPKVVPHPPENWVECLRPGHRIWLVKEQRDARVAFPWDPPEPGHMAGRLAIDWGYNKIHVWYVTINGCGLDGDPLILPYEGHLPKTPGPLEEPEMRAMRRQIHRLFMLVGELKLRVSMLEK